MSVFRVWHKLLRRLPAALGVGGTPRPEARSRKRRTIALEILEERAVPATWYVAPSGSDQAGFGTDPGHPFATIQVAVNNAGTGDVIKVAAGTYHYNASQDLATANFGTAGVVNVYDKQLTLLGGFSTDNWNLANSTVNPTIIDGGGTVRGVYVVYNVQPTGLDIEGFTIQNGVGTPNTKQATPNAYGGGMYVDETANPTTTTPILVQNVIFRNDTAQANTTATAGGLAAGGGFAVIAGSNVTLNNVTFQNDRAIGGTGLVRGGAALGGGFYATNGATVTGNNLTFLNNAADAGSTSGTGIDSGNATADALGGGVAVQNGANVAFASVSITGSTALGGNAGTVAGAAFGGGAFVQNAALALLKTTLTNNVAESGSALTGNGADGGGVAAVNADLSLNQVTIGQNTVQGGNSTGGSATGATGGGGVYLTRSQNGQFGSNLTITNALIDDNVVRFGGSGTNAGGGGGLYAQGVAVSVTESTIANNQLGPTLSNGYSILTLAGNSGTPTALTLTNDIIANAAANASASPLTIQVGSMVTVNRTLFVVPGAGTPLANGVNGQAAGTLNTVNGAATDLLTAPSAGFISPGAPNYNYGLLATSPARGQAINNSITVDRAGNPRPVNADLGAFQFATETVQFQNLDNQVSKAGGAVTIAVVLSAAAPTPVSVDFSAGGGTAQAGVDYTPVSGTLTFTVGETVKTFTIPVFDDGAATGDLRINLTLSNPVGVGFGFQTQAVATLLDYHPTDNEQFISGLYHDLLTRSVDQPGLTSFITPLLNAEEPQLPGILFRFVNSVGYFEQLIGNHTNGFYHRFFGEDLPAGDPNVAYWANQMVGGMTDEQVVAAFLSSSQYFNDKSGGNVMTWLQNAYHDVLNRPLDPAGASFWLTQLNSGALSLNGVALALASSPEYRFSLITTDFELYLNRPTNSTDRMFWLTQFQAGMTDEQVIQGIGGSIEGLAQNGATNAKWFTTLYQKLLGRSPSADELTLQLNALENDAQAPFDNGYHLQRYNTARAILSGSEFAARGTFTLATDLNTVIAEVYQQGLHRSASASDVAYWSTQFRGDPNQNLDVASAILASSEYFNAPHVFP